MKLKPCPFCAFAPKGILIDNRPVLLRERVVGRVIVCPRCTAKGPYASDDISAILAWNRRPKKDKQK
jgi:hypothetical protein